MEKINEFIFQSIMVFAIWFVVPIVIFCVVRILFSLTYGFGKLIGKGPSNGKVFKISRFIGVIMLHIPVLFHPINGFFFNGIFRHLGLENRHRSLFSSLAQPPRLFPEFTHLMSMIFGNVCIGSSRINDSNKKKSV